jgi:hypothetical protein
VPTAALLFLLLAAVSVPERTLVARAALEEPALDVAFLDAKRLFVLSAASLSLYRLESDGLVREAQLPLPGEALRVRAAAGLLRVIAGESACWATTNARTGATLFTLDGGRLAAVAGADAIPPTALPPGSPSEGARYAEGTNEIALAHTRLLRLTSNGIAVGPSGELVLNGEPEASGLRMGDALADVGPRLFLATSPAAPADTDEVRLLRRADPGIELVLAWAEPGRVRALAALTAGDATLVAVALDTARGPTLGVLRLAEAER